MQRLRIKSLCSCLPLPILLLLPSAATRGLEINPLEPDALPAPHDQIGRLPLLSIKRSQSRIENVRERARSAALHFHNRYSGGPSATRPDATQRSRPSKRDYSLNLAAPGFIFTQEQGPALIIPTHDVSGNITATASPAVATRIAPVVTSGLGQSALLDGAADLFYMAALSIGNPPQQLAVILDSGSSDLWVVDPTAALGFVNYDVVRFHPEPSSTFQFTGQMAGIQCMLSGQC